MPVTDAAMLARLDALAPGRGAAILAEVALIEMEVLAARCAGRTCDGKALGGVCADCPADAGVFDAVLPDLHLEITPAGRDALATVR
ncbi:hypothetical protein [Roseospira goensis]|uniref:Uncharacterized protein n=1 Tax=Roseospira goensis TaxID=391922 RepID=A0A7W6S392_9PROT|nr:hypothetical protein [Roseospira goensis]MBB4287951.1 hypothetical protein [Roseospira goensis]